MTHYELLGVSPQADIDAIHRAYLRAARQAHPDMPNGDEARMRELNVAWNVLGDPHARAAYDRSIARPTMIPPVSTIHRPDTRFVPHPAYDGVADDDPMLLDDDGDPATNPGKLAQMLPVGFWAAAFLCVVVGSLIRQPGVIGVGFVLVVLGAIGFLATPLLAMGRAASIERASDARREAEERRAAVDRHPAVARRTSRTWTSRP